MIVIANPRSGVTIKVVGRSTPEGNGQVNFYDKTTQEEFNYQVTLVKDRYYVSITDTFGDLVEDHTYEVRIFTGDLVLQEIWRGLALVSAQSDYSINNGEFTERTTTNDYIILE